jgi:hypothetical protein
VSAGLSKERIIFVWTLFFLVGLAIGYSIVSYIFRDLYVI